MIYLWMGLFAFWVYFPLFVVNIGPFPPLVLIYSGLAVHTLQRYRNVFSVPKWYLYVLFAGAIAVSQINAPDQSEFGHTAATVITFSAVPFAAIWFRPIDRYYRFFSYLVLAFNSFVCFVVFTRPSLTFSNISFTVNGAGSLFILATSICWPIVFDGKKRLALKLVAVAQIAFNLYLSIFHVASRASILIQLFTAIIWLTIALLPRYYSSKSTRQKRSGIVILLAVGAIFLVINSAADAYRSNALNDYAQRRITGLFNTGQDSSVKNREAFTRKAWEMFKDFPINGGGWNHFTTYKYGINVPVWTKYGYTKFVSSDISTSHSIYIKLLAETGSFGVVSYAILTAWQLFTILQLFRRDPEYMIGLGGIWTWFIAYRIWGFSHEGFSYLYLTNLLLHALILDRLWESIPNGKYIGSSRALRMRY